MVLFVAGALLAIVTFSKTCSTSSLLSAGATSSSFYTPNNYLSLLVLMMLVFGLGFEFPVVLCFLMAAGVLKWQQLAAVRRYAIVGIFVVVAVITPSGDPVTLLALSVPMCIFYEVSIQLGRVLDPAQAQGCCEPVS